MFLFLDLPTDLIYQSIYKVNTTVSLKQTPSILCALYHLGQNKSPKCFEGFTNKFGNNHTHGTRATRLAYILSKTITYGSNNLKNSIARSWNSITQSQLPLTLIQSLKILLDNISKQNLFLIFCKFFYHRLPALESPTNDNQLHWRTSCSLTPNPSSLSIFVSPLLFAFFPSLLPSYFLFCLLQSTPFFLPFL